MARRKQQNPKHLETSQELATTLQNGITASSDNEDDEHVCGKCRAEFLTLSDFLKHKITCVSKRPVLVCPDVAPSRENDSHSRDVEPPSDDDRPPILTAIDTAFYNGDNQHRMNTITQFQNLPQIVQRMSATNVTIAELRNTTVAVSQHGRNLPRTQLAAILSELRRQQAAQMHAIEMLSAEILGEPISPTSIPLVGTAALTPPQSGSEGAVGGATPTNSHHPSAPVAARTCVSNSEENAPLLTENDGSVYEPNTLELLQRHTEKALQQTMCGTYYLSNIGLKRTKDSKQEEPQQRHRCRFCGKYFGSDSALQIHVRSHTGERPFKCNVCGSCFSTRGNLKVHFQRHKERLEIPPELMMNGDLSNPPQSSNGDAPTNANSDLDQNDRALDFSTNAESCKSPQLSTEQRNCRSRSITPNEMSALSDDESGDISVDDNLRNDDHEDYDDDDDDDDRASNLSAANDNMDLDSDNQLHSSPFTSPSFGSIFRPSSFSSSLSENIPVCLPSNRAEHSGSNAALHQDPTLYQELLPRIGSNDNSWESLMEVTETSETSKLQKLVDNIEVADPNQCIICQRVLSCRSALQMHYRTHTGERPFKCKICGRAFTTKGNLKTHMGVHRHKPPSRVLHQCPVCHKQFANSIILQQHIRMHTAVTNVPLSDNLYFPDDKNQTLLPPSYPRPMALPQQAMEPLALTSSESRYQSESLKASESVIKIAKSDQNMSSSRASSPAASTSSGDGPNNNVSAQGDDSAVDDVTKQEKISKDLDVPTSKKSSTGLDDVSPVSSIAHEDNAPDEKKDSPLDVQNESISKAQDPTKNMGPAIASSTPLKKEQSLQTNGQEPSLMPKPENTRSNSIVLNLPSDKPLPMNLPNDCRIPLRLHQPPDRQIHHLSVPNSQSDFTTSLTALENQVKAINSNTTSPLPFPAPYGLGFGIPPYYRHDFGFGAYASSAKDKMGRSFSPSNGKNVSADSSADERSTPGSTIKSDSPNISSLRSESGALDLTPRGSSSSSTPSSASISRSAAADLKVFTPLAGLPFPPSPHSRIGTTCQICFKTFACQSALEIHYRSHTKERPFKCDVCDRGFSTKGNMKQHMLTHKIRDLPPQLFTSSSTTVSSISTALPATNAGVTPPPKKFEDQPSKRPSNEGHSPKRPPGIPKHVCEVCRKPFSSGSALQIHMRTHTGVKPFQCNICSRAFTTKGNLKVHMGTHLSTSGTSRRGRRMSLDISPLNLPTLGKPGEFPRPDMFFPYLPPFMKSVLPPHPPPKMNEISVIQSAVNRDDAINSIGSSLAHHPSFGSAPPPTTRPIAQHLKPDDKIDDGHKSPIRSRERSSSTSPGAASDMTMVDRNTAAAASWGWKIACNRCNKICSSSTELELHISAEHAKNESTPSVENLSVVTPKSAA